MLTYSQLQNYKYTTEYDLHSLLEQYNEDNWL